MAKKKNGINSDSIKKGMETALEVTKKTGEILVAAATVIAAAKTIKGGKIIADQLLVPQVKDIVSLGAVICGILTYATFRPMAKN